MDLEWLWPLLVGAGLTVMVGSAERLSVHRREDRRDARQHVSDAFALSTRLAEEIHDARASVRFGSDPVDPEDIPALRKLRAIDERMPTRRLRRSMRDALQIISYAPWVHRLDGWKEPAGHVQEAAAVQLRSVLAASERGDRIPPLRAAKWLRLRAREATEMVQKASDS